MRRRPLALVLALVFVGAVACADDEPVASDVDTTTTLADPIVDEPSTTLPPNTIAVPPTTMPLDERPTTTTEPPHDHDDDPEPLEAGDPDAMANPTEDDPAPGGLPPVSPGTPIRVLSCTTGADGITEAIVELDNVSDLPLDATVEVLFEDADATPLERALGSIARIEPGTSGTGTVSSGVLDAGGIDCLLIGLERREIVD